MLAAAGTWPLPREYFQGSPGAACSGSARSGSIRPTRSAAHAVDDHLVQILAFHHQPTEFLATIDVVDIAADLDLGSISKDRVGDARQTVAEFVEDQRIIGIVRFTSEIFVRQFTMIDVIGSLDEPA